MNIFQQSANGLQQAMGATGRLTGNLGFGAATMAMPGQLNQNGFGMGAVPNINAAQARAAGQIANTDLSGYMNPYTQNVIDTTMGTLDRQRNQMLNQVGADATAAGAFGGSRHGLVEAETNRGFADTMANTAAGLNQSNFQNAQQMGLSDIQNRMNQQQFNTGNRQQANIQNAMNQMNAGQFNANQALNVAQQNVANQMQGGMFNAQQQQQANQFGANTNLAAANQLGNMANMGFGMGQQVQQMQGQAGAQQQAINQALIDAARGQYGSYQGQPQQSLQNLIAALGGAPNQSTTTQSNNPGLLGMLTGGASMLGGLASAGLFCWVSRAAFGADNPEWLGVRKWMLTRAPKWLFDAYVKHGPDMAAWIERNPVSKPFFSAALRQMIKV